ncbi:MAG: DUF2891 domain-containing protein [Saprospirales bacterium]|nr:DUF2891 domain-containing protein [Saprospirales bacterium]
MGTSQNWDTTFLSQTSLGAWELTEQGASHFAQLALHCVDQEYPNKLNQVLPDSTMLQSPQALHPAFYGCFDWHSAVHGHWMLVRLLKQFPQLPEGPAIREKLAKNLTPENIQGELAYLATEGGSWERMYGWAWLLKLAEELAIWQDEQGQEWFTNLAPLTDAFVQKYTDFLPIQEYPVRTGVHPNTAFGIAFAWDYANTMGLESFRELLEERAMYYFASDQNCPASWEPSGEDFLSPCLEEAYLMSRFMREVEFRKWWNEFLPPAQLESLCTPVGVADRTDPKIVHLDGLNLSRAWCFYRIAASLNDAGLQQQLYKAAGSHLQASLPYVVSPNYEGSHWLASFAVFALNEGR